MIFIFICLFQYFQNVHLLPNHDIEIEGKLKIGDFLLNELTNNLGNNNDARSGKSLLNLINNFKSNVNTKKKGDKHFRAQKHQINNRLENEVKNGSENEDEYLKEEDEALKQIENPSPPRRNYIVDSSKYQRTETKSAEKVVGLGNYFKHAEIINTDSKEKIKLTGLEFSSKEEDSNEEVLNEEAETEKTESSEEHTANSSIVYAQLPKMKNKLRTADFLDHVVQNGRSQIQSLAEHIQSKLGVRENDSAVILKSALDSYTLQMNRYISHVMVQDLKLDVDKEFLLLDIVASCNMLLYSEQRQLLNKMIEKKVKNVTRHEIGLLTEKVFKQYISHKKQEIFYMCQKLNICRSFPGFSDYLAEFFGELLKLPDDQLRVIIKEMANLVARRTNFFKAFMKDGIANLIGKKLQVIYKDLFSVKETLTIVRSIVTQRFKMMETKDYQLQVRTKAVRILIDIIDKTFSLATSEDLTLMTFDTVVKALRRWTVNNDYNINEPLKLLMQHIVSVITHNWDEGIRQEVATLTEVIMTGKTDEEEILEQLFSRGADIGKFVNVIPDEEDTVY